MSTLNQTETLVVELIDNNTKGDHSMQQQIFTMLRANNGSIERIAQHLAIREKSASAKQIKVLRNQVTRAGETLQSQEGTAKTDPDYMTYSIKCVDRKSSTFEIILTERKEKSDLDLATKAWKKVPSPANREALNQAQDAYEAVFFGKLSDKMAKLADTFHKARESGDKADTRADKAFAEYKELELVRDEYQARESA